MLYPSGLPIAFGSNPFAENLRQELRSAQKGYSRLPLVVRPLSPSGDIEGRRQAEALAGGPFFLLLLDR